MRSPIAFDEEGRKEEGGEGDGRCEVTSKLQVRSSPPLLAATPSLPLETFQVLAFDANMETLVELSLVSHGLLDVAGSLRERHPPNLRLDLFFLPSSNGPPVERPDRI